MKYQSVYTTAYNDIEMWEGGLAAWQRPCTFKSGYLLVVFFNSIIHGE
jgi:hypothetical protein